jgi:multidrug resistance protein, MATE family
MPRGEPDSMKHTQLTIKNFSGLAIAEFLIGSVTVGFGVIDLVMIAPKGSLHVAAVGLADLIIIGLFAFFGGIADIFAARLAQAEGSGQTMRRLPALGTAFGVTMVGYAVVGVLVSLVISPLLRLAGQDPVLIPLVDDYTAVRLYGVVLTLSYVAVNIACRICGLRNATVAVLCGGFTVNAILNWLFLYGPPQSWFASPERAVASATVGAQVLMLMASLAILAWQLHKRPEPLGRTVMKEIGPELASMSRTAPGVGIRHLNDYMGSIIPMMFVGTLGVSAVAAMAVGAKIFTLFCRVPQSCVGSAFVYYGYEVGRATSPTELRRTARTLVRWTAIPTGIATVLTLAFSPWLVRLFGGADLDRGLAIEMLVAYLVVVPVYIFGAAYGEILTVHQRGGLMSLSSTVTTWFIMIPIAAFGVFVWHSAPLALGLGGVVSTAVIVFIFRRALEKGHWSVRAQPMAEAAL